jgi:hypothetical protein
MLKASCYTNIMLNIVHCQLQNGVFDTHYVSEVEPTL